MKNENDESLRLKVRNVIYVHRDRDRFSFRRDSASADLSIVRLLVSLAVMIFLPIGTADVKGAYMQSGPSSHNIYVRHPKAIRIRGVLWKLLRLPYGISEARYRLCAI